MKLHPRVLKVQQAGAEIGLAVSALAEKHDLTVAEAVKCLLECTHTWNTLALRAERHPEDPGRKSGEA